MPQLVEVRFKGNRKAYFEWHEPEPLRPQEPVVVEAERGLDYGLVSAVGDIAQKKCDRCRGCALNPEHHPEEEPALSPGPEGPARHDSVLKDAAPGGPSGPGSAEHGLQPVSAEPGTRPSKHDRRRDAGESRRREPDPVRKVVRRATATDRRTAGDLRRQEDEVRRRVREKASGHGLQMKVSDAEWQWDRNKLTVYFTADKRVDFRALVRDLASAFRTRIELRQIGVRDEAARLSGIGRCGRELCSASWLPELRPIGLQVAKDQRLSLNPSQISGPCGRLLCCLRFEHEFYVQSRKRFPKEGKVLQTARGAEKVWSVDIFRDRVNLKAEDGSHRTVALDDLKQEMEGARGAAPASGDAVAALAEPAPLSRPERPARPPRPPGRARQDPVLKDGPGERPPEPGTAEHGTEPVSPEAPRRRRRRRRRRRGPPPA